MEITMRSLWTLIHGMGFGALYLLACSGGLVELYRFTTSSAPAEPTPGQERFLKGYMLAMVVLAWAAVLTGAYVIYPWYRAAPPPGTVDRRCCARPGQAGCRAPGRPKSRFHSWHTPGR